MGGKGKNRAEKKELSNRCSHNSMGAPGKKRPLEREAGRDGKIIRRGKEQHGTLRGLTPKAQKRERFFERTTGRIPNRG